MSHLDEQISDLVDGRLDGAAADQVAVHLARCSACRQMAESERLTKARLRALTDLEPPAALAARLLALPQSLGQDDPEPAVTGHVPGTASGAVPSFAPAGSRRPAGSRPPASPAGGPNAVPLPGRLRTPGRPQRLRMAAAVAGSVGAVSAGLFGISVVSPAANAALVPSVNLVPARSVVNNSLLPMLSMPPAWWVAAGVSRR